MTDYIISKSRCLGSIMGVCPGCGGALTAIETVDNSNMPTYWSGCESCATFSSGVPEEVYRIACYLIKTDGEIVYRHMDNPRDRTDPGYLQYWESVQIKGMCSLVQRVLYLKEHLNDPAATAV